VAQNQGEFRYGIVVDTKNGLKNLTEFTKAQAKSTQRIEKDIKKQIKANVKHDRSIIETRAALSKARAEYKKYTTTKKADALAADAATHKMKKLNKELFNQTEKLRKGRQAVRNYTREIDKLANAEQRAANRVDPRGRTMYPAPISPQRPGAPMMGPGFAGTRGFSGSSGRRAGITRGVKNISTQAATGFSALGGAAGGGGLLAPIASGLALQQSVSGAVDLESQRQKLRVLSEQYGDYNSILKIIEISAGNFNKSQREATTEFANVYARLRPLGVELHQIKGVYEGFNAVAIASGATSESTRIAFMQLSQAIGSGRLAGDEFRSVSEQIPGVLIPIAKEMGVTVGELKKLGSEGKITSDVLINSLSGSFELNKEKIKELIAQQPAAKFKAFSNAVSDLGVAVGDTLLPVLLPLVQAVTDLLRYIIDLPAPIRNVGIIAASAALGVTALAVACKTLGLNVAVKFVGGLAAAALGIKGLSLAAVAAMPKLLLLKTTMLSLARLGFITLGINIVINGLEKLKQLEARFNTLGGGTKEFIKSVGGSSLSKQEIDKLLKENQTALTRLRKEGNVADDANLGAGFIPADKFTDDRLTGFDDAARQQLIQVSARRTALQDLRSKAVYNNPEDRAKADSARALAKLQEDLSGKTGDKQAQIDKIVSEGRRRLAFLDSKQALKLLNQRYQLQRELEKRNHTIAEANAVGIAQAQLSINHARIEAGRALREQQKQLEDAVTAAEARVNAARQRLSEAAPGADMARAQNTLNQALSGQASASADSEQFRNAAPSLDQRAGQLATAQSTAGFRDIAQQAGLEAQALRTRNRLLMEGVSPARIEGLLRIDEIEREAQIRIQTLNQDLPEYNENVAQITANAQLAKDAVNELTIAQKQNAGAIGEYIGAASEYINNIQARIVDIASTIEQSISTAILGLVNGTMSATQAFQSFFKSVGEAFLKMAAQMIAKLIIIKLLKSAIGMFGGGGAELPTDSFAGVDNKVLDSILPTVDGVKLATGGIVTGPTNALIGEGGMNEAVVPLPNGRSIPVDMGKGGGAGAVQTNITVNVDQGGQTDTETSGDNANKLGKAIDSAVKRVIMDERRVGGLLYNGRR
jgi:tape measure domain-containing protein